MHEVGVIHGRFQIFHLDHLRYVLAGKARCRRLVVGITNPDPLLTRDDAADPSRSAPRANPLTYYERYVMVRAVLVDAGIPEADFDVVPFPVNLPELYRHYLPMEAVFFLTVYDDWGRRKLELFRSLGLETEILWSRPPEEKGLAGSEIRRRILAGEPWEHMVPPETARLIRAWNLRDRLCCADA